MAYCKNFQCQRLSVSVTKQPTVFSISLKDFEEMKKDNISIFIMINLFMIAANESIQLQNSLINMNAI